MKANHQYNKLVNQDSLKGLIDTFFPNSAYSPVEEELWNWFVFALSDKGVAIKDLQADDFAKFSDQLTKLVAAVYQWANSQSPIVSQ